MNAPAVRAATYDDLLQVPENLVEDRHPPPSSPGAKQRGDLPGSPRGQQYPPEMASPLRGSQ